MSDTIEVNGITFTKEKPARAGYYLYATVNPNMTWVYATTVEPEYVDATELGCWHYQWHPVSELNYYWHRLVPEQELSTALARIKRLEEIGDWIVDARTDDELYAAIKAWTQAKEAR